MADGSMVRAALNRIVRDTGNPNLPLKLQDAIRNRVAFLFVRGADGFVLKPLAEDGVIGVLVWAWRVHSVALWAHWQVLGLVFWQTACFKEA